MYRSQWKYVQILLNSFWKKWRDGHLQSLQVRRKWTTEQPDLNIGDVVLVGEKEQHRNYWPVGVIDEHFSKQM